MCLHVLDTSHTRTFSTEVPPSSRVPDRTSNRGGGLLSPSHTPLRCPSPSIGPAHCKLTLPEVKTAQNIRSELARYRRAGDCGYVIDCVRMAHKQRTPAQVRYLI